MIKKILKYMLQKLVQKNEKLRNKFYGELEKVIEGLEMVEDIINKYLLFFYPFFFYLPILIKNEKGIVQ